MIRLQRYLVEGGQLSRREAEERIAQGRVTVNGTVATPGTLVDPDVDRVKLDMETVRPTRHHIVLMMHKPTGVVCSEKDPEGRKNVNSLLPELPVRVHTVGRLDIMSEGLLLFTNDGDLTRQLTRSASGFERVYEVKIQGGVPDWALERIERGVNLDDGRAQAASCKRLRMARTNEWLEIVMTEGRYREVRRMFQSLGMNVLKLKRVRFGPIRLGKLPTGASRILTPDEVTALTENRAPKPQKAPKAQRPARGTRSSRAEAPVRQPKPAAADKPERAARPGATRTSRTLAPDRPARPGKVARPEERSQLPGHAAPSTKLSRIEPGTRQARPARPESAERRPRTLHGGTEVRRGRPETARSRAEGAAGRPEAARGRPEAPRGRPEAPRGRPDREQPVRRAAAPRFDADRGARHDDDYDSDSGPGARRFEAEVAAAVRKAEAMKGARPATRIGGAKPAAAPRGHAARSGGSKPAADHSLARTGRTSGTDRNGLTVHLPRAEGRPERSGPGTRSARPEGRPERSGPGTRTSRPEGRPERSGPGTRSARPEGRPERSGPGTRTSRPEGRPERSGPGTRSARPEGRPARSTRTADKPTGRPRKPSGKPQRSVHANKPQKV
jgi:23S rRNA pseudouridine2605 synthase